MAGQGPGFWRLADGVLGGKTVSQVIDGHAAAQQAAQQRQQLQGLLGQVAGNDPEKLLLLQTNLKAYTDAQAKNYEPANIGGGDSRAFGNGRPMITAPKLAIDNGFAITQTPGQASILGQRPMGYNEAETNRSNLATEGLNAQKFDAQVEQFAQTYGLDVRKLDELIRSNRAGEGLRQQQINKPTGSGVSINLSGGLNPGAIKWD